MLWNPQCTKKAYKDIIIITNNYTGEYLFARRGVINNIIYYINHDIENPKNLKKIENILIEKKIIIKEISPEKKRIEMITVMITNRCNLKCKHCCANDISWINVSYEKLKQTLDEIIEISPLEIIITGGEPMMYQYFFEIMRYIRSNYTGLVRLSTNGTLINEKNVRELVQVIDKIDISLDGIDNCTTSSIRGENVWQRVMDSIILLKANGMNKISTSMVLSDRNREYVKQFKFLNKQYNTEPIIRNMSLSKNAQRNINYLFVGGLKKYEINEIYRIEEIKKENGYSKRKTCGMIFFQLFITASGNIYPCAGLAMQDFYIGNIQELGGLRKFYMHEMDYFNRTKAILFAKSELERCLNCGLQDLCWKCLETLVDYSLVPRCLDKYCEANKDNLEKIIRKVMQ